MTRHLCPRRIDRRLPRVVALVLATSAALAAGPAQLVSDTAVAAPTASAQPGPVVIVGAHPDDETLGAGGLIARRAAEGRRIVVIVLTDGRALLGRFGIERNPSPAEVAAMRKDETRRALDILTDGRAEVLFLDYENERLLDEEAKATIHLTKLLRDLAPGELYTLSPFEGHREHVATNRIVRSACATIGGCGDVFEFIVTLARDTDVDALPRRRLLVDVSAFRDRERRALAQFRSHLDVISPIVGKPLAENYDRYLTDDEPYLADR